MPGDGMLDVSEQPGAKRSPIDTPAVPPVVPPVVPEVELYMIRMPRHRHTLFVPRSSLDICTATESDRFGRFIRRILRNRNAVVRWVGRVTRAGHRYYQKLEDRIDPLERMIKALNCPTSFHVLHAPSSDAESRFRILLRAQVIKHTAWLIVDGVLTTVAAMFFWVLVPIPGPNVMFYYPALRLASHYRAITGARRARASTEIRFEALPDLARIEEELGNPSTDLREDGVASGVEGLGTFLKRMV